MSLSVQMMRTFPAALCGMVLLVAGCAETPPQQSASPPGPVQCTEPRPQVCTMIYQPVCALKRDGTRQTYASGCTACADPNVTEYLPGECG